MEQSPLESKASATKTQSEKTGSEGQTDILSMLPTREGWGTQLVLYNGFWLRPFSAKSIMQQQGTFEARHDDIILASNPKCGTTWLKALAFTIINRSRYHVKDQTHPLRTHHPQELVPFMDVPPAGADSTYFDTLPSPRLLSTHTPFSLLPKSITEQGCRIVYICRDPKDAFVSRWHFMKKRNQEHLTDLDAAVSMFCEGFSPFGPFWDHCLEFWNESVGRPDKVLFLKYENLMTEPVKLIKVLAAFMAVPFTCEEEDSGVPEEAVRLCSFEMLSGANQAGIVEGHIGITKSDFFRKGKVGDWVNHLSAEMGRKIDCTTEEKLMGSGLVF